VADKSVTVELVRLLFVFLPKNLKPMLHGLEHGIIGAHLTSFEILILGVRVIMHRKKRLQEELESAQRRLIVR
jgi:uncharacterized membrane-anchored protein